MSHWTELRSLTLAGIAHRCTQETDLFFQRRSYDPQYCFELFRRALEDEEASAWLAIDQQYRQLILRWGCDCAPDLPRAEVEQAVTATLPKFWQSLTRSTEPLTRRFTHVGAVLKYLKQCTVSVLLDYKRQLQRTERIRQRLESDDQILPFYQETEQELATRIEQEQLLPIWNSCNFIRLLFTIPKEIHFSFQKQSEVLVESFAPKMAMLL